jgi:hypothetical protein
VYRYNAGGCQSLTCTAGCLLAWYADAEATCVAKCDAFSSNPSRGCIYKHSDVMAAAVTVFEVCRGPSVGLCMLESS